MNTPSDDYLSEHGRGYAVMINSGNGKALYRIAKLIRQFVVRDLLAGVEFAAVCAHLDFPKAFGQTA